jgi:hypothetical protein
MMALFILLVMIAADRTLPDAVRIFSPGILPWAQPEKVKAFYRSYGWISFPRSIFVVATPILVAVAQSLGLRDEWVGMLFVALFILWWASAMRDIYRAGTAASDS